MGEVDLDALKRIEPWQIAAEFHRVYEAVAPTFGYATRRETAVAWEQVPQQNKALMIAVARGVVIEWLGLPDIIAGLERAERVETAAWDVVRNRGGVDILHAALAAAPGDTQPASAPELPPYVPPQAPHDGRGWTRLGNGDLLYGYWRITGSPTAWTLLQERGSAGAPTSSNNFGRFATIRDAKLRAAEIDRETSTRRVQDGVVHEMADLGVKTQCGLDLQEPWTWTDDPVTCESCQAVKAAAELAEERVQVKEA